MPTLFEKIRKIISLSNKYFSTILSCMMIYFIFLFYNGLEFEKIKNASKDIDIMFVLLALLSLFCSHYFASQKYSIVVNRLICRKKFIAVGYIAYFSSLFANIIPFGPSADICRVTMLKVNHKISVADGLLISVIDRVSSAIYVTIFGLCCLIIQFYCSFNLNNIKILLVFWSIMTVFCMFFLILPFVKFIKGKNMFKTNLLKLKSCLWLICFNYQIAIYVVAQLFFISLSFILCIESLKNFKYDIMILLLTPFIQTVQTIPFFFSGWGVRELSFIYLLPSDKDVSDLNQILLISILFGVLIFFSVLPSIILLKKKVNLENQ